MRNLWRLALGLIAALMALAIYPRQVEVAPAVDLLVRDDVGKPAVGVLVKQDWGYQAPWEKVQTVTLRSDDSGHVRFPQRSVKVSLVQRLGAAALDAVSIGHYGRGPHAIVWAYGTEPHIWSFVYCSVRDERPHEVVLKSSNVPMYVTQ